jgi:hypothetical protein
MTVTLPLGNGGLSLPKEKVEDSSPFIGFATICGTAPLRGFQPFSGRRFLVAVRLS